MKTNILRAGALALVITAAAAAAVALAQGPGYGPGFGGGQGYGPGMMGGYGLSGGALAALDLTDEQRDKILAIQEENRRKNWDTMGQMRGEMFKLQRMFYADKTQPNAVAEQQKKVDELRRQMLRSRLETRSQIEGALTPDQRKQMRSFGPWWLQDEALE